MKPETPTIAVDVMGSDLGPEEIIIGIKKALSEDKSDFGIIVVGREETITPMLLRHNLIREQRVRVYNASEVIGMDEKPIQAIKTKKDSSMMRAIEIVKLGTADAVLSCGNTGALMAGGTIKLRTMRGIERPLSPARQRISYLSTWAPPPTPSRKASLTTRFWARTTQESPSA